MFVPRSLRLKGVKEPQKARSKTGKNGHQVGKPVAASKETDAVPLSTEPLRPGEQQNVPGPRFTIKPITHEYLGQLLCGLDLIFSDYAHQEQGGRQWLEEHYRTLGAEEKYVHLSAILSHPNIASLKPAATQPLLQRAMREQATSTLELSEDGYHVRRRPSTYPLPFVPPDSFHTAHKGDLSFWDQRTIYVEPHTRDLCKTPAKVAWWLKEHGKLKDKWLPIQAVKTLFNSCAFVILSGNVLHEDVWQKWRNKESPEWWKVMTKVEHTKRTNEYLELLKKDNPRPVSKKRKIESGEITTTNNTKHGSSNVGSTLPSNPIAMVASVGHESTAGRTAHSSKGGLGVDVTLTATKPKKRRRKKKGKDTADEHQALTGDSEQLPDAQGINEGKQTHEDNVLSDSPSSTQRHKHQPKVVPLRVERDMVQTT